MQEKSITQLTVGEIATNCWIYPLSNTARCALIDPGAEADRIIACLRQLNLVPQYIILTHGHFDHIAALPALAAEYCGAGGAEIAIHRLDSAYLGPESAHEHLRCFAAAMGVPLRAAAEDHLYADIPWDKMPKADRLLEEGDTIGPFTVLHLPGHTPGSIALWDKETNVLFSGDTLFQGNYGRTDLPGGNEEELFASLRHLLALDRDIHVLPGHGPATTIGREAEMW